ncbi:MAG: PIN domain nuclease [Nitrospira sp.]|nr:PIN domain nuclease [bacterium]MBL7049070.1 PIN domain nuclease [Nitrospira sp.]
MIVVDSSVWIDYFNGNINKQTDWLNNALGTEPIIIGDIILAEVLQGFQSDKDFKIAKKLLLEFQYMDMVGQDIALKSVDNYRALRQRGVTVRKTIDVMIGTFCIHHKFTLLHNDKDFEPIEKHLKLKTIKII